MMKIKVLGTGCTKCKALDQRVREVAATMGVAAEIEKEENIYKIMQYGVMSTPALVINEKVVASGFLPSENELKELINKNI